MTLFNVPVRLRILYALEKYFYKIDVVPRCNYEKIILRCIRFFLVFRKMQYPILNLKLILHGFCDAKSHDKEDDRREISSEIMRKSLLRYVVTYYSHYHIGYEKFSSRFKISNASKKNRMENTLRNLTRCICCDSMCIYYDIK